MTFGRRPRLKTSGQILAELESFCGYPLALSTEATLDLAEDEELMQLMGLANFWSVFVGIESPNEASLKNVRPKAGTLLERVHRIQSHGLEGMARHDRRASIRRSSM